MQTHEITQESSQDQFTTWQAEEEARTSGTPLEATEEKTPVEEPKEPEPEPEAAKEAEPEEVEEKLSNEQKRINRLTAEKYKAQAERDVLKAQLDEALKGKPAEPKAEKKEAEPAKSGPVEPQLKDFADWELYQTAHRAYVTELIDFKTAQVVEKALADRDSKQAKTTQEQQAKASGDAWIAKEKEFAATNPDYYEAVHRQGLTVPPAMAQAIVSQDNGAAIAYFLGKNQSEADAIAAMDGIGQAIAIGKLAERLTAKAKPTEVAATPAAPKERSKAPAPPNLLTGKSAPMDAAPDPSDFQAFERWERKHFPPKLR